MSTLVQPIEFDEYKLIDLVPGLKPNWRKHQKEIVQQISESNKKFIGIQAPTGFGKSLVAIASMKLNGGRGIALTQTKQLGEQYFKDYMSIGLKTVKGRGNFECRVEPKNSAADAPCTVGLRCRYKFGGCSYYDQKNEAKDAPIASMNIHYFLYEANHGGQFSDADIIFIDEAHKLENTIFSFVEIKLSKRRMKNEGYPIPSNLRIPSQVQEWGDSIITPLKASMVKVLDELQDIFDYGHDDELLRLRAIHLSAAVYNLEKLQTVDSTWIVEEDDNSIILKPIFAQDHAHYTLFRHAQRIILMSATLPETVFADLGIQDYDYFKVPSTFSPESRPILWLPVANLARSAEQPEQELKKLVLTTDKILEKFSTQKGIIHTVNYKIANAILSNSKFSSRLITHKTSKDREKTLDLFRKSNRPLVLVSPSFTEGVDLPYELCKFQIIAKIPFMDLGDKKTRARFQVDEKWYASSAITQLVQAYGRIMRAEDDSGVTYILDKSLMNLINRWRFIFDQLDWFLEALWITTDDGKSRMKFSDWELEKEYGIHKE